MVILHIVSISKRVDIVSIMQMPRGLFGYFVWWPNESTKYLMNDLECKPMSYTVNILTWLKGRGKIKSLINVVCRKMKGYFAVLMNDDISFHFCPIQWVRSTKCGIKIGYEKNFWQKNFESTVKNLLFHISINQQWSF